MIITKFQRNTISKKEDTVLNCDFSSSVRGALPGRHNTSVWKLAWRAAIASVKINFNKFKLL